MDLAARKIKLKIEKGAKRPTSIDKKNAIIILYSHEKMKIRRREYKFTHLKYSIYLPEDILSTFLITPALRDEGLQLTSHSDVNKNERIRLEFFNKTYDKTFTLRKKLKITIFMTLNKETADSKTEFEKINTTK